jgi:hypothetical protein
MIDLTNKCLVTETANESERLLRFAVAQGYALPKGLKVLTSWRIFKFTSYPYKAVSCPDAVPDSAIYYSELFGDENADLKDIILRATRFCRSYGYNTLRLYADETDENYTGSAFSRTVDGGYLKSSCTIPKPRKVTLEEIEKRFGCPIEIVS